MNNDTENKTRDIVNSSIINETAGRMNDFIKNKTTDRVNSSTDNEEDDSLENIMLAGDIQNAIAAKNGITFRDLRRMYELSPKAMRDCLKKLSMVTSLANRRNALLINDNGNSSTALTDDYEDRWEEDSADEELEKNELAVRYNNRESGRRINNDKENEIDHLTDKDRLSFNDPIRALTKKIPILMAKTNNVSFLIYQDYQENNSSEKHTKDIHERDGKMNIVNKKEGLPLIKDTGDEESRWTYWNLRKEVISSILNDRKVRIAFIKHTDSKVIQKETVQPVGLYYDNCSTKHFVVYEKANNKKQKSEYNGVIDYNNYEEIELKLLKSITRIEDEQELEKKKNTGIRKKKGKIREEVNTENIGFDIRDYLRIRRNKKLILRVYYKEGNVENKIRHDFEGFDIIELPSGGERSEEYKRLCIKVTEPMDYLNRLRSFGQSVIVEEPREIVDIIVNETNEALKVYPKGDYPQNCYLNLGLLNDPETTKQKQSGD